MHHCCNTSKTVNTSACESQTRVFASFTSKSERNKHGTQPCKVHSWSHMPAGCISGVLIDLFHNQRGLLLSEQPPTTTSPALIWLVGRFAEQTQALFLFSLI